MLFYGFGRIVWLFYVILVLFDWVCVAISSVYFSELCVWFFWWPPWDGILAAIASFLQSVSNKITYTFVYKYTEYMRFYATLYDIYT